MVVHKEFLAKLKKKTTWFVQRIGTSFIREEDTVIRLWWLKLLSSLLVELRARARRETGEKSWEDLMGTSIPDLCHNHHTRWLCKKSVKCKIFWRVCFDNYLKYLTRFSAKEGSNRAGPARPSTHMQVFNNICSIYSLHPQYKRFCCAVVFETKESILFVGFAWPLRWYLTRV